jgi:RNA-directed DNA polymerase
MSVEKPPSDEGDDFLTRIGSESALRDAWRQLNKTNPDSYGLSSETITDFRAGLDAKIPEISRLILEKKYRFSKSRASLIPKDNGKLRPLQIPEVRDRLVLKSLAIQIEKELQHKLKKSDGFSFAYQKGIGIRDAMHKLVEYYNDGYHWVVEADIINFFDKVGKDRLLNQFVFPDIPNSQPVQKLIQRALNSGLDTRNIKESDLEYFKDAGNGIPQGNALSPLFSNIYLYSFDVYMIDNGYRLIRYADDFIVMCKSRNEAEECFKRISKFLKTELELDLHPLGEKSKIVNLTEDTLSFLSITFDGKKLFPSQKNFMRFKASIDSLCHGKIETKTVVDILQRVKNALDGWLSSYLFTDVDRYFEELDSYINKQVYMSMFLLDWKFLTKTRGKLNMKFRVKKMSPDCLSDVQRKNSGIPLCVKLITERRRDVRDK